MLLESFEKRPDRIRYAYEWDNNGVKLRVVVDDLENKNKIFDFYSDRNTTGAKPNSETPAKPNPTQKETTSQEKPLSILEKSQLEKEKKLESERLAQAEKERIQKIKDKEQAELNAKIREQKNATLGKSELDRQIAKSGNIPYKELENAPKSSVSLNDDEKD